jgi:energy-coupling factor transporter ATP-binding protein EcfA2
VQKFVMARLPKRTNLYFTELMVKNIRAFAAPQVLRLHDADGSPSRWTLLLGENGVGKTTLLQCLARMRPVPASDRHEKLGQDAGEPDKSEPELSQHENEEIYRLVRLGPRTKISVGATFSNGRLGGVSNRPSEKVQVGLNCYGDANKLRTIEFVQADFKLNEDGPLVVGYGAARHIGHENSSELIERDPTASLFSDAMDLYDAEEILSKLHYATKTGRHKQRDKIRFDMVRAAVAALLPGTTPEGIDVRGPKLPGRTAEEGGIHVSTPSGAVPISELSLGYQTVFAWTVDLAWRLYTANPHSKAPLAQPAIVLIDEIDLHLHPRWQREIRRHLTTHFPGVQFIATTHSPITAQESLSAGANVSVVKWEGDHSIIINDPIEAREWRFDQILTSDLFGFESARSPAAEAIMNERLLLVKKKSLSAREKRRLRQLDGYVETLPTAASPNEQEIRDILRKAAKLSTRAKRK